jgi:hypothetical protein
VRSIVAFLRAMEHGRKLVSVERLAISRQAADTELDEDVLAVTATVSGLAGSSFHVRSVAADTNAHGTSRAQAIAGGAP